MGKVCPLCKREQPKLAYKEGGGKVNAKKKKGKAAACSDCKAAGGDCVKLSAAGFILAGIPDDHQKAQCTGVYSKTGQIVNSTHLYSGPNGWHTWHDGGAWVIGTSISIVRHKQRMGALCGLHVVSIVASPETISNDSVWEVVESHENEKWGDAIRRITTTALTAEALAAAKHAANTAFDEAIEKLAPSFVLSGLDSNHHLAEAMGLYERQDEREKVNRRFVYKGPDDMWAWSGRGGREWSFGEEEDIGQSISIVFDFSSAPTPESIVTTRWKVAGEDGEWQSTKLTITAINYKPAELFKGTCTFCVQCREWRRCGKGSGCSDAMCCSEACQRAR